MKSSRLKVWVSKRVRDVQWRFASKADHRVARNTPEEFRNPRAILLGQEGRHTSCGYYDISPFDEGDARVLVIQIGGPLATPAHGAKAKLGFYKMGLECPPFIEVAETICWNWQQGARLRWCPAIGPDVVAYSAIDGDKYATILRDVNTGGIVNVWCRAAYDISPDGRYALSLNFSRLHRLRPGYGYGYLSDETTGDDSPEDDGVWSVDPEANDARLLFALGELAGIEPHASMIGADHYINHISISPDGGYFLFLHLWYNRQNRRRYSRLFVARENGSELKLLFNGGLVSHYTWLNNEECLVVTRIEGREDRYVRYHVRSGFNGIIGLQRLVWDGHPSLLRTGKLILDTYPDQERMQTLYTYDVVEGTLDEVARWRMPVEFTGEMRCDLHPHASASRNYLAVDMVRAGFRHVSVIAASDCLDKTKGWCEAKASLKGDR